GTFSFNPCSSFFLFWKLFFIYSILLLIFKKINGCQLKIRHLRRVFNGRGVNSNSKCFVSAIPQPIYIVLINP
ncbi:hypothetical protein KKC00_01845, partial [Patescibacteria group bacterium]|nr:hypothetical protein [Patescibacteria group bacterium]